MAIAFRAAGARTKVDVIASGSPQNIALPTGHLSGDLLLMVLVTDDNTTPTTPSGWTRQFVQTPGASTSGTPRPRTTVLYRIDNGSLGANVAVTFSTASWPTGSPYVLGTILAYTGCDTGTPIGEVSTAATTSTANSALHPIVTTTVANDWLLTIRSTSSSSPAPTFTNSVGTDVERVDDSAFGEIAFGIYDSNIALAAGAQAQRTTTASQAATYGSVAVSLAIRPAPAAGATVAAAGTAEAFGSANGTTATHVSGAWDCAGGLPSYTFAIDWDGKPTPLNSNSDFETTGAGWNVFGGATYARVNTLAYQGSWSGQITTTGGASPRIESDKVPVTAGTLYKASGWMYTDAALAAGISFSVNWYTAANAYISTSSNIFVPPVGAWQYADGFFPAPATAAQAGILLDGQGTPAAGIHINGDLIRLDNHDSTDNFAQLGPGENVTPDILSDGVSIDYGRDQMRQLSPTKIGTTAFSVVNADRQYSPENTTSVLFGNLDPARQMKGWTTYNGVTYPLGSGRIDDYNIQADRGNRSVDFTFLDGLKVMDGATLSTPVLTGQRTGDLINYVLDQMGWTGGRDIDPGATVVPFWWEEGTSGFDALKALTESEGPPSIAYIDMGNNFIFRDRHHRVLRPQSLTAQATFAAQMIDCAAPAVTGLSFTPPFTYAHGWRDIVNSVSFDVTERAVSLGLTAVWTSSDAITLSIGESRTISISGSDPFINAITPVVGTDFTVSGIGVVQVQLSRTSGVAADIVLTAAGGSVVINGLQLRAQAIPVVRTTKVSQADAGSVLDHGERSYPNAVPWASVQDAYAIATMILLHYAQRRPTVQLRITASDPEHFSQIVSRMISDRIHITNAEMGIDNDFFIEQIGHKISRMNQPGRPPVHAVTFGCEKDLVFSSNPFRFDVRGAGFDQGVFDPLSSDNPASVFIFDSTASGLFDTGQFGT